MGVGTTRIPPISLHAMFFFCVAFLSLKRGYAWIEKQMGGILVIPIPIGLIYVLIYLYILMYSTCVQKRFVQPQAQYWRKKNMHYHAF